MQQKQATQFIPLSLEKAWDFFSDPRNLSVITPPWLKLKILKERNLPKEIHKGLLIEYEVYPFPFLKQRWVTEIVEVQKPYLFIDEQKKGPYTYWHHEHRFKEVEGGVMAEDVVHYKLPFGSLGELLGKKLVSYQIDKIFDYRKSKLKELFPNEPIKD